MLMLKIAYKNILSYYPPLFLPKNKSIKKTDWIYANVIEFNVEFNVKSYTKQNSTTRHVGKGKNIPVSKLTLKEEMLNTHLFLYYMCFQYSLDYRHNCIQTGCYYSFHVHMDLNYYLAIYMITHMIHFVEYCMIYDDIDI